MRAIGLHHQVEVDYLRQKVESLPLAGFFIDHLECANPRVNPETFYTSGKLPQNYDDDSPPRHLGLLLYHCVDKVVHTV